MSVLAPDARTLFARIACSIADHVLFLLPLSSRASMQLLLLVAYSQISQASKSGQPQRTNRTEHIRVINTS